ncbi:MAG: UDP-N-acetylmuramyl-tripeptide synthetase [Patescibacteria group bacterium]|nr:UDP-N-acetylmuramyl-tripeptide synthetase [Patescibacteria group bacterium]
MLKRVKFNAFSRFAQAPMSFKDTLRKAVALDSPIRVGYHYARAALARAIYGGPGKNMIVIGITGTKGKSTVTNLIAKGLEDAGKRVFAFSTVNYAIAGKWYENNMKMTSPDPFTLNRLLSEAEKAGCEYAVIEVSSHALFYGRVAGIDFDVAVMTNISQDHLDLHKTMDHYVETKLRLFRDLVEFRRKRGIKKVSVVNLDSPYSERFLEPTADTVYTYGNAQNAQIRAIDVEAGKTGTSFTVKMPSNKFAVRTKLRGQFNVANILAATAALISQKIPAESIAATMAAFEVVPGRLEEVPNDRGITVFVDYAHTEESLRSVLETVRSFPDTKRVITVFGATGDRDRNKRPKMGRVVDKLSDVIILTQDDDYTEDPFQIIKEVSMGIKRKEGDGFWVVFSREDAIRTALLTADSGDVVVVAGKGAETVMVTNAGPIPWNDKAIIRKILEEVDANVIPN